MSNIMAIKNMKELSSKSEFVIKPTSIITTPGGIFVELNDKYKKIADRFGGFICGLEMSISPMAVQAVSMTDAEIESTMTKLMAIIEANKNKNIR